MSSAPSTATISSFDSLELLQPVLQAVEDSGYTSPSEIQVQCIPHLLAGKDIIGQAQTGTGKTAAFALPLLCNIETNLHYPQVLVLTPTRELAIQVAEAFQTKRDIIKSYFQKLQLHIKILTKDLKYQKNIQII